MDLELLKKPTLMGKYEVKFRTRNGEVSTEYLGNFGTMDNPEKAGKVHAKRKAGEFISIAHISY